MLQTPEMRENPRMTEPPDLRDLSAAGQQRVSSILAEGLMHALAERDAKLFKNWRRKCERLMADLPPHGPDDQQGDMFVRGLFRLTRRPRK